MEANQKLYKYEDSKDRIDDILNGNDSLYEDKDSIPPKGILTFNNGFYVKCSALFIDIRDSKSLANKHKRPVQAKIYKTYISELVAVLNGHSKVNELYIEGDCVWGIFNTPNKEDINELFDVAAQAASLVDTLNVKYKKKNYTELSVGIGISYGTSLLIKSGYKGSGINEVVWLGKLVAEAAELCSFGNKLNSDYRTMVSAVFYDNLKKDYQDIMYIHSYRDCYHGNIFDEYMNKWVTDNR